MTLRVTIMQAGPVPPAEGPFRDAYLDENGERELTRAQGLYGEALASLPGLIPPDQSFFGDESIDVHRVAADQWEQLRIRFLPQLSAEVESLAASAALSAINSFNYLEDRKLSDEAHLWIHKTAAMKAGLFGCCPWVENGEVWTDCPVRISHLRMGVSAELTTVWGCSICGARFDECPHDPNATYEVIAERKGESCGVCFERECEHVLGKTYPVSPFPLALSIEPGAAIAWVARPRYPLARISRKTLDVAGGTVEFIGATEGTLRCRTCQTRCCGFSAPDFMK